MRSNKMFLIGKSWESKYLLTDRVTQARKHTHTNKHKNTHTYTHTKLGCNDWRKENMVCILLWPTSTFPSVFHSCHWHSLSYGFISIYQFDTQKKNSVQSPPVWASICPIIIGREIFKFILSHSTWLLLVQSIEKLKLFNLPMFKAATTTLGNTAFQIYLCVWVCRAVYCFRSQHFEIELFVDPFSLWINW